MKKTSKIVRTTLAVVILCPVIFVFIVIYSLMKDVFIIEENQSAEHMRQSSGIPFSSACHSIFYYLRAAGLQDLSVAVKFSCNKDKVNEVLAELNKLNDEQSGEKTQCKVSAPGPFQLDIIPTEELAKLKWWDIQSAKIEHAVITKGGYAYSFWVTQAQGNDVTVYLFHGS